MKLLLVFLFGSLSVLGAIEPALLPNDKLKLYHDANGRVAPVSSPADWAQRRAEIVRGMESVMGAFPGKNSPKHVALDVRIEEETDKGTYIIRRITYQSEPGSRTPAYLCIPKAALKATAPTFPAVLCLHPTSTIYGVGVVVGIGNTPYPAYANELAARGFVAIAPAYPHLFDYKPDIEGLGYASGTMKAIWDNTRALDLLETLPFVKRGGYGVIGHSLGGHNAIFTAVFEPRLVALVTSCGFDSFVDYAGGNPALWAPGKAWGQFRYMPRMSNYAGRLQEIPFDFHGLIAALAPRPVFVNAPLRDGNFKHDSVDRIVAAAREIYALHGATDAISVAHPDCEHDFPIAERETAYRLFDSVLR